MILVAAKNAVTSQMDKMSVCTLSTWRRGALSRYRRLSFDE